MPTSFRGARAAEASQAASSSAAQSFSAPPNATKIPASHGPLTAAPKKKARSAGELRTAEGISAERLARPVQKHQLDVVSSSRVGRHRGAGSREVNAADRTESPSAARRAFTASAAPETSRSSLKQARDDQRTTRQRRERRRNREQGIGPLLVQRDDKERRSASAVAVDGAAGERSRAEILHRTSRSSSRAPRGLDPVVADEGVAVMR